jgi:hypothetical protein
VNRSSKTDGSQSLQLEATKHTACEYSNATVQPDTDYLLSFDYQGEGTGQAGYYLEYTGAGIGKQEQIDLGGKQWQTFTERLHIPETVTDVRLYLHAYEGNGTAKNTVRFDNVRLVAIPSTSEQFYVLSEPTKQMKQPQNITFQTVDSTHRSVYVTGATEGFVLSLSESFHQQWRLEMNNSRVSGANAWLPGRPVDAVGEHFKLSNYMNAWYIDPDTACASNPQGCTRHPDGSYDLEMLAEFVPQRWFAINRAVAVGALLAAVGYVAFTHRRTKRDIESEGIYRHPLTQLRKRKK